MTGLSGFLLGKLVHGNSNEQIDENEYVDFKNNFNESKIELLTSNIQRSSIRKYME